MGTASKRGGRVSLPWIWIALIVCSCLVAIVAAKILQPKSTIRQDAFVIGGQHFERDAIACAIDKTNLAGQKGAEPCSKPWVSYDPHKEGRVLHVLMPTGICQTCVIDYRYAAPIGVDPRNTPYWQGILKISKPLQNTDETFWCIADAPECLAYIDVKGIFWTLQIDRSEPNPMALYRTTKSELEKMAK